MIHKRIKNSSVEGVALLKDLRRLTEQYGYGEPSFEWSWKFYDFEIFNNFYEEFALPMILSFIAVLLVILVITSDFIVTTVVAICVLLTDLFLVGLIYYWNL